MLCLEISKSFCATRNIFSTRKRHVCGCVCVGVCVRERERRERKRERERERERELSQNVFSDQFDANMLRAESEITVIYIEIYGH